MVAPQPVGAPTKAQRSGPGVISAPLPTTGSPQGFLAFVSPPGLAQITPPAGWTLASEGDGQSECDVFVAGVGAGTDWNISGSGTWYRGVMVQGYNTPLVVGPVASTRTNTSPTVTTTTPSLIVRVVSDGHDANTDITYPTNATLGRDQWRYWDGTFSQTIAIAHSAQTTAGATGTAAWTIPSQWEPDAHTLAVSTPAVPPTGLAVTGADKALEIGFSSVSGADSYLVGWQRTDLVRPGTTTQTSAPYQVDRIDQGAGVLSGTYTYDFDGTGVIVYLWDSGVRYTHQEFTGRTLPGFDTGRAGSGGYDTPTDDHGTGTASMALGTLYGSAKGAKVSSIRLDVTTAPTYPPIEDMQAAAAWMFANHPAGVPGIINFSWEGRITGDPGYAEELAMWVSLLDAGFHVVTAAGNTNITTDGPPWTPAADPRSIVVAASNSTDAKWASSNFGSPVTVWAPGEAVLVAGNASNTASRTTNGTSYAAPLVSGVLARVLQANPHLSPARGKEVIASQAYPVVTGVPAGTTNIRLNAGANTDGWSSHKSGTNTLTLDGLEPGTAYAVRVAAVTGGVASAWSSVVPASTATSEGSNSMIGGDPILATKVGATDSPAAYLGTEQVDS